MGSKSELRFEWNSFARLRVLLKELGGDTCFPDALLRNVQQRCGYKQPTPLQEHLIPFGLAGRDVFSCAPAGSGKTAAFLIPVVGRMMAFEDPAVGSEFGGTCQPAVLILAQQKERCQQIYEEALRFCDGATEHRCAAMYSADSIRGLQLELANGVDLLVVTPSCLVQVLKHRVVDLHRVAALVLDEVACMGNTVDGPNIILDICGQHGLPTSDKRQTMMFNPSEAQAVMARKQLFADHIWISQAAQTGAASEKSQRDSAPHRRESARLDNISRSLTQLLRHRHPENLPIRSDGYCSVRIVCASNKLRQHSCEDVDITRVVQDDRKGRFETKVIGGILMVRATQGHSLDVVEDGLLLEPLSIDSRDLPRFCVHGTYRAFIKDIRRNGLLAGGVLGQRHRRHVHFATSPPGRRSTVVSGMRTDCEIAVWVDLQAALQDDVPFFRSTNGVICSPGVQGVVAPKYISKISDL